MIIMMMIIIIIIIMIIIIIIIVIIIIVIFIIQYEGIVAIGHHHIGHQSAWPMLSKETTIKIIIQRRKKKL